MKKIFISYRREDVAGHAWRLHDHLVERLGKGSVFIDVDDIHAGDKFDACIEDNVKECDACLVVIGPRWRPERTCDKSDFVRREIVTAIRHNLTLVPVLFDGAKMPPADSLPADLALVASCQAYDFGTSRNFKDQIKALFIEIDRAIKKAEARKLKSQHEAAEGIALRPHQYPLWVLLICGVVALSVVVSLATVSGQLRALKSVWMAEQEFKAGNRNSAILDYQNALVDSPTSRTARLGLAIALFSMRSQESDNLAMNALDDMELNDDEWNRLAEVAPERFPPKPRAVAQK